MEELSRLFKKARETKVELPPKVTLLNENGPMMLETGPKFDITKTGAHTTKTETHTTTGTRSRRTKFKRSMIHQADPRASRTVFIGNLPLSASKKDVLKLVLPYGAVESLRQRSVAIAPGKLPVNIARKVQKQQTGSTSNFYVVMATEGGASACLELNGRLVDGRHIRVDLATPTKDVEHSVFVGNLPFNADEESVRELFQSCGDVDGVRLIKDNRTGIGKGFGYVKFKDSSGVLFACKRNEKIELGDRKLRVFRCHGDKSKKKTKFGGKKAHIVGVKMKGRPRKKIATHTGVNKKKAQVQTRTAGKNPQTKTNGKKAQPRIGREKSQSQTKNRKKTQSFTIKGKKKFKR